MTTKPAEQGRIAVLGGAGGIGRAVVADLTTAGYDVVALDLAVSLTRHASPVPAIEIDILSETSVETAMAALADRWSAIDGFVNLAGYTSAVQPLSETSSDYFDDIVAGNLRGAFLATKAVLPMMADNGSIVLVASGLAQFVRPGHGAYAASKAGLIALAKTFAVECAPRVRVNAVAPGLVQTAFLTGGTGRSDEQGQSLVPMDAILATVPLQRHAVPEDIAGPIRFLLEPASSFMTGQVLWVNGGAYMP